MSAPAWRLVTLGRVSLLDPAGRDVEALRTRPRKLALLAYLALAARPVPRAQLVELFWGDREEERARGSLSEALSHLRRVLGRDGIPAHASDAALAPGFPLTVDVAELEAAARAGEHELVLALHAGPFLDGLHIPDAVNFDRWVDRQRGRAGDRFIAACAALGRTRLAEGAHEAAAALAGRWLDFQWDSSDAALLLVQALAAPGTPAARRRALAAHRRYVQRLADELGARPPRALADAGHALEQQVAVDERKTPPEMPRVAPVRRHSASAEHPAPVAANTMHDVLAPVPAVAPGAPPTDMRRGATAPHVATRPDAPPPVVARRHAMVVRTGIAVVAATSLAFLGLRSLGDRTVGAATLTRVTSPADSLHRAALARWTARVRDDSAALALLDRALALDSTHAAAALLRHRIRRATGRVTDARELRVAARHAARVAGRERLLLDGELRLAEDDVRALATADTLLARHGDDDEAVLLAARIRLQAMRTRDADALARRVLDRQGTDAWGRSGGPCTACEATELRLHAAWTAGDVARCEALAAEYAARAGTTPRTLFWAATLAEANGLWAAADSLFARSALAPHDATEARRVRLALRAGDLAVAEEIVRPWLTSPDPDRRVTARFTLAQLLREQGRAREGVASLAPMARTGYAMQLAYGALLLDAGEPRRAAALFADAETRWLGDGVDSTSPFASRIRTWALAHEATARAAAGDTAALLPLAARMQRLGRTALLGRVPVLHHWPRALLWQARGVRDSTVAALRRVLVSPTQSHLRAAWLLGRELVAAGRPAEARTVIEQALVGPTEASGYYVTRTELHAVRAAACAALGDTDCVAQERARVRRVTRLARVTARRTRTELARR